ncbi:MAG TPA: LacI family DNA-binding transcriptional regulator [Verrucomicrobiae bacterium]|nr:LacI family DNA-binding transcriptional regulator [Verrucomicrobiae bacterium]
MNLEEVARRAGVSIATASRVLNNAPRVKDTTRVRVMSVVEKLKYHPNLHARCLAGGRSRSIGVIVSNIENPFFRDIYTAVETAAHAEEYEIFMANTDYRAEQVATSVRSMMGRRVAGLAAIVSEMDQELVGELNGYGIPVVFYDVGAPRHNITVIRVNYRRGIQKLTSYLYSLGHRRMGIVGHHTQQAQMNERLEVAMEIAARYGDLVVETAADVDSLQGGCRAARRLLAVNPRLTAMMCVNDSMAVGAMREIRDQGLRVPDDISVTGFDDVELAQFCYPALTSVRIPRDQIAKDIWGAMVGSERTRPGNEIMIEPELILRESTGPAAKS